MNKSRRLIFAWCGYALLILIFLAVTKIYHDISKAKPQSNYQYRILIDKNIICDNAAETDAEGYEDQKAPPHRSDRRLKPLNRDNSEDFFYERTRYGYLPKISSDGDRVFDVYAAKFVETGQKKVYVVVYVDDYSIGFLRHVLKILGDFKVTFVVPHYVDRVSETIKSIFDAGHEIFLQIPTQFSVGGRRRNEMAPFMANTNPADTIDKLQYLLSTSKYIIGIANASPTLLTKSKKDMTVIVDELSRRGMTFLDLENITDVPEPLSEEDGIIHANAFLVQTSALLGKTSSDFAEKAFLVHLDKIPDFMDAVARCGDCLLAPISSMVRKK
ncbi:MAG: divergent polysaccharide deacetylase family protein [Holosporaceae bacterium]|jgi:polysaccharide deacetylase 2 family uncharacterized protein YibQ|nr:divergent polysaccharide deacetylase family protein [Holosporaceae bacterium]